MNSVHCRTLGLCVAWLWSCSAERPNALAAGSGTVFDATQDAFSLPIPTLNAAHRSAFFVGNSYFNQNWLSAPSTINTRDGLGPLFNARSCSTCHFKDGRGQPPATGEPPRSVLVRISLAADGGERGPGLPDPVYGDQLQTYALPGVPAEAKLTFDYDELPGQFADGESYSLRRPRLQLAELGYGPLGSGLRTSVRAAPALIGVGMLEAVPEAELSAHADPSDADRDGISGRLSRVWDVAQRRLTLGRFGWKAEQPSVSQQVALAFNSDLGITSSLYPRESCTAAQAACIAAPSGGAPELSEAIFDAVARYARTLAVPARRQIAAKPVQRGAAAFERARCARCHLPRLHTGSVDDLPELAGQDIQPYTDLLLHDLGEGLSDHRATVSASGSEWRTAPLWGLGLIAKVNGHQALLHDGRARGVREAVLWHGGEAEASKQAFVQMTRAERTDLVTFVESL